MNGNQLLNLNVNPGDYKVSVFLFPMCAEHAQKFHYFAELFKLPSGQSENHTNPVYKHEKFELETKSTFPTTLQASGPTLGIGAS